MAVCALSACHVERGATFTLTSQIVTEELDHQYFLAESLRILHSERPNNQSFDLLKVFGLIALYSIEIGDNSLLHEHLGFYHTLLAQRGFHNETRWPNSLTDVDRQVRRHLFWSMYRLEVHSAIVMGHVIRCPEMQSAVGYPVPSEKGCSLSENGQVGASDWVVGWNYVTDLYRVTEHFITSFRAQRMPGFSSRGRLLNSPALASQPKESLLHEVSASRKQLPLEFSQASHQSSEIASNRRGFQVANITCTFQVRIKLFRHRFGQLLTPLACQNDFAHVSRIDIQRRLQGCFRAYHRNLFDTGRISSGHKHANGLYS